MLLWRISNYQDLKGIGGLTKQGRWHSRGKPIVYLAEHPALAMLEVLVHFEIDVEDIPDTFKLLTVNVPQIIGSTLDLSNDVLLDDWHKNTSLTQSIGDQWLAKAISPLLKVPSAVMPFSSNYLLNPLVRQSQEIEIIDVVSFPFDERLLKKLKN